MNVEVRDNVCKRKGKTIMRGRTGSIVPGLDKTSWTSRWKYRGVQRGKKKGGKLVGRLDVSCPPVRVDRKWRWNLQIRKADF